jgi:hypothetical protein
MKELNIEEMASLRGGVVGLTISNALGAAGAAVTGIPGVVAGAVGSVTTAFAQNLATSQKVVLGALGTAAQGVTSFLA